MRAKASGRAETSSNRRARPGRPRRAFTLVELLVALMLLNVGLLALVGLAAAVSRDDDDARAAARAARIASAGIERMASVRCSGASSGSVSSGAAVVSWFSDLPTPNDTRLLRESVTVRLSRGQRIAVLETRARC